MEVLQVLHMNGGAGETSYARNSVAQKKIISILMPVAEEAILDLCRTNIPESLGIADLGCGSGPNTLFVVSMIMDAVYGRCCHLGRSTPEFRVVLNDLPGNDFNSIFVSLPAFYSTLKVSKEEKGNGFGPCFISGVPGSFYGRLVPSKSLHFVHSSSSLHWLSQVPPSLHSDANTPLNKGKIYISKTSPPCVFDAYLTQFQKDFSLFLKSRSEEIVSGGRMVLSFFGRSTKDPSTEESCDLWDLLAQALGDMVLEGVVEEEKLDSFNFPYYSPCPDEVEAEIQREGSFIVDRLELFEKWDGGDCSNFNGEEGQLLTKTIRAVVESMLEAHFGGGIMDDLFRKYGEIVSEYLSRKRSKSTSLIISMIRKGQD